MSATTTTEIKFPVMDIDLKPELIIKKGTMRLLSTDDFEPSKHIDFHPPSKVHSMSDLKLPEGTGVSSFAVSEPFKLFTEEAIERMRAEIFTKPVLENCQYSSNLAHCQLRGFADK